MAKKIKIAARKKRRNRRKIELLTSQGIGEHKAYFDSRGQKVYIEFIDWSIIRRYNFSGAGDYSDAAPKDADSCYAREVRQLPIWGGEDHTVDYYRIIRVT